MAARICILNITEAQAGFVNVNVLFWFPVASPYPNPGAGSSYPAVGTDPATQTVVSQLQLGTLIEEGHSFLFPTSWIAAQWATAVEPLLLAYYNARLAVHSGTLAAVPDAGLKYKILNDSVNGWSA